MVLQYVQCKCIAKDVGVCAVYSMRMFLRILEYTAGLIQLNLI